MVGVEVFLAQMSNCEAVIQASKPQITLFKVRFTDTEGFRQFVEAVLRPLPWIGTSQETHRHVGCSVFGYNFTVAVINYTARRLGQFQVQRRAASHSFKDVHRTPGHTPAMWRDNEAHSPVGVCELTQRG